MEVNMAQLKFYANIADPNTDEAEILHDQGHGLGFFGLTFGQSVPVGDVQSSTYVVDETGQENINGLVCQNTSMATVGSDSEVGSVNAGTEIALALDKLPNYLCPLKIRFENAEEAVKVTNCKLRIFDRTNPANQAQGVKTYVYEARHPIASTNSQDQLNFRGRDSNTWVTFGEGITSVDGVTMSELEMTLTPSPGENGSNGGANDTTATVGENGTTNGAEHYSTIHDWYIAISAEPTSIGSKVDYGLYFTLEYLA